VGSCARVWIELLSGRHALHPLREEEPA